MNEEQRQVIIGSLLGDGHLCVGNRCINPYFCINRSSKDEEYLRWESKKLENYLGNNGISFYDIFDKRTQKTYKRISLRTRADSDFLSFFKEWYPNKKKIIPADLILTPLIVAIWFADDGHISRRLSLRNDGKTCKVGHYEGSIATNGFTYDEVVRLKELLEHVTGGKFSISKIKNNEPRGAVIKFTTKTAIKLIKYIKDVFPPLSRKSNVWNSGVDLWRKEWYPNCIFCNSEKRHHVGFGSSGAHQFRCLDCGKHFLSNYKQLQGEVKTAKYINNLCHPIKQV